MKMRPTLLAAGIVLLPALSFAQTVFGPSPYLSFADSPFAGQSFSYFHLEDFEDNAVAPGWSASQFWRQIGPTMFTDSVDGDDGLIDGSGAAGGSFYSGGAGQLTITFDAAILGALPTSAGIVWTDVGSASPFGFGRFVFEAYDRDGALIGGPSTFTLGEGLITGQTPEDRFWGVGDSATQISRLVVTSLDSTDWEVDHLQFGFNPPGAVPEPSTYGLIGAAALLASVALRRRLKKS